MTLALYGTDFPTEGKIPCKAGDAGSCKINRKTKHPTRCNFYRRTLDPETLISSAPFSRSADPDYPVPKQSGELRPQPSFIAALQREASAPVLLASADPDFMPEPKQRVLVVDRSARQTAADTRADAVAASEQARQHAQAGYQRGKETHKKRDENQVSASAGEHYAAFAEVSAFRHPQLHFDHGFLDDGLGNKDLTRMEEPTVGDYAQFLKWEATALGARVARPDLSDGVAAYLHFLHGEGADFELDYEAYVEKDQAGRRALQSAIEDVRFAAIGLHEQIGGGDRSFLMQSEVMAVGALDVDGNDLNGRYPYAGTEDWQKAIGAHVLWIEAEVSAHSIDGKTTYDVMMKLQAEDMYNFNPGNFDLGSGVADAVNGRLEIVGLGHEFISKGHVERNLQFENTD